MSAKQPIWVLICALGCLLVGYESAEFQRGALETWYPMLIKSPYTPRAEFFPAAWTALYVLMGASIALVISSKSEGKSFPISLFIIQLALNFLWTIFFFHMQLPFWAFIDLVAIEIFTVAYAVASYRYSRTAMWLIVPYILWTAFAIYLNGYIVAYN